MSDKPTIEMTDKTVNNYFFKILHSTESSTRNIVNTIEGYFTQVGEIIITKLYKCPHIRKRYFLRILIKIKRIRKNSITVPDRIVEIAGIFYGYCLS